MISKFHPASPVIAQVFLPKRTSNPFPSVYQSKSPLSRKPRVGKAKEKNKKRQQNTRKRKKRTRKYAAPFHQRNAAVASCRGTAARQGRVFPFPTKTDTSVWCRSCHDSRQATALRRECKPWAPPRIRRIKEKSNANANGLSRTFQRQKKNASCMLCSSCRSH